MIRTDKLRGIISERGMSQSNVAHLIGITPRRFMKKCQKVFLEVMRSKL